MPRIDKKELKEHVLKCGVETIRAYETRFKMLNEWQQRFDCLRSTGSLNDDIKRYPWQGAANVGIPLDATVIYTIVSRLIKAEFGVDPSINVRPYDLPYSPHIQRYINWQMYTEMDLFIQKILWYQGMAVDGDKIIKTIIDKDEVYFDDDTILYLNSKDEPYESKDTGAPMEAENEEQKSIFDPVTLEEYKPRKAILAKNRIVYYGPKAIPIPAKHFLVPQNADNIDPSKVDWVIHEFWKPYGWVHQKAEQYPEMFDKDVVAELRKKKDENRVMPEDSKLKVLGVDQKLKTKMFKFHEWHGRWEDDKGNEHEIIALAAPEQKKLVGYIPNRYFFRTGRRQFVHYSLFPQDGKFWGRGVPEILRGIRSMLDSLFNTDLDNESLYRSPLILYNLKQSGFDPAEHKFGPGKTWGLNNISEDMIRGLDMPNRAQNSLQYQQILYSVVQRLFGLSDFSLSGAGTKGITGTIAGATSKAAGGIAQLIQEGNIRFDVFVRLVQQWSNPELALQIFKHFTMNRHSIMEERDQLNKPAEIFDPIMELSEDEINKNFEYSFPGNTSTINPIIEQMSVGALWDRFGAKGVPMVSDDPDVMNALIVQSFNAYGSKIKIKSVDEYRQMMATEQQKAKQIRNDAIKKEQGLPQGGGREESNLLQPQGGEKEQLLGTMQ